MCVVHCEYNIVEGLNLFSSFETGLHIFWQAVDLLTAQLDFRLWYDGLRVGRIRKTSP